MARGPIPDKDPSRPTVPEVRELVDAYYEHAGNTAGGNLHIVLDDFNIADHHIQFCLELASEMGDDDGVEIAEKLLQMTTTQRRKVVMGVRPAFFIHRWSPPPRPLPDAAERIKAWNRHLDRN